MTALFTAGNLSQAAGVNIHLLPNGEVKIDCCIIRIDKKALVISKKLPDTGSLMALKEHIPPDIPVALNVTGKGVLSKRLDRTGALSPEGFLSILPDADMNDFYIQQFTSGDKQFIALIRKIDADPWLQDLRPLTLSLGPFAVSTIWPQINTYGLLFTFDGHHVTLNEKGLWETYKPDRDAHATFPIKIESETIREDLLIPYAVAFQLALHQQVDVVKAGVPEVQKAFNHYVTRQTLKKTGTLTLIVFFVLLLVNFLLLTHFNAENKKLEQLAHTADHDTENYQRLAASITENEARLSGAGWDGGACKSCLVSQFAALLPTSVTLTAIQVNPSDTKSNQDSDSPAFKDRKILVTGTTSRIVDLNEWMAMIRAKNLVSDIALVNYRFNSESGTGIFLVEISY